MISGRAFAAPLAPLIFALGWFLAGCAQKELALNEIQVLASHNSYKLAIDPPLLARIAADNPALAPTLDYAHLPLEQQLELGVRALELDVYYDPEGGRYATPLGIRNVPSAAPFDPEHKLALPGFKVLHVQDIDFRSSCITLADCLATLRAWSQAHPRHVPIVITVNAKDDPIDSPGFVQPLPFDAAAYDALDAELRAGLGSGVTTPDDVRGTFDSLERAVLERGWPSLDSLRGRFIVVLDESLPKMRTYVEQHPALAGRLMFANMPEGTPEAAVRIINEPIEDYDVIQTAVRRGYLVRTRADADTNEARDNARERSEAAFVSGAQIVSTDYYVPDQRFGNGYVVALPGGGVARCNPLLVKKACVVSEETHD